MPNKPYHQMTKAEQIAFRIAQNGKATTPAKAKANEKVIGGTRREVTAENSSFLFQTIRGVL